MKRAFTLVELIVVITILAILWTIWFISLSWYSAEARDSKRITESKSLLNKIVAENTRWVRFAELITDTRKEELQILWTKNPEVKTFWIAHFENLKENALNFKDPSKKTQDYLFAYVVGWSWTWAYSFIQTATISEKQNKTVITWNYYTSNPLDAPSLFKEWEHTYKNDDEKLIYDINESWSNEEILACTNASNATPPNQLEYTEENWNIIINWYTWTNPDVVLPCEIDWKPVKSIWDYAFCASDIIDWTWNYVCWTNTSSKLKITSIFIPNSVEKIWNYAFWGSNLTSIDVPDTVKTLWEWSFIQTKVKTAKLPKNLEVIPYWLFKWAIELTSITFPTNLKEIWAEAFIMTMSLAQVEIPDTVIKIWDYAFNYSNLSNLTLWQNLQEIWTVAFKDNKLTSLVIPNSVTTIWNSAFSNNQLSSLEMWNNVTNLWTSVFKSQTWCPTSWTVKLWSLIMSKYNTTYFDTSCLKNPQTLP